MSRKWKVINTFVLCVWVALLSLLLYRNYTGAELEKPQAINEAINKNIYWYDIYVADKKIGFASTSLERIGGEIIIKHDREMKVSKAGQEILLVERMNSLSDTRYSIKSFEYSSHFKGEKGIRVTGEVDAGEILFFLESPEKRKTYKTAANGDFYLPTTFLPAIIQKNPAPNSTFAIPVLDISKLSVDPLKVTLEEIRPLKIGLNVVSLYKFKAGDTTFWCDEKGFILKEEDPSGVKLYSQTEKIAMDPADRLLFDYTQLPSVKANILIDDSETLKILKVRVKNFRYNADIYANSVVSLDRDTLTIRAKSDKRIREETYRLPYAGEKLVKYIHPDEWVMSDYEPLHGTGRIYAKSYNNDAFLFSEYLTNYLFKLVRTMPKFVLSNSEQIFKSLSGDYLERTVMFATYARAAGLPTRLVGGLVYRYGYFYFHTWPEVWLQEWVPVDPTLDQFPADVTHIPLAEGTLKEITSIVGELKAADVEILEAK
jgi:hypothetical protein